MSKTLFAGRVMSAVVFSNSVKVLVNVIAETVPPKAGEAPQAKAIKSTAVDLVLPKALGEAYLANGLDKGVHVAFNAERINKWAEGDRFMPAQMANGVEVRPKLLIHSLSGFNPQTLVITKKREALETQAETDENTLKANKSFMESVGDFASKLFKKSEAKAEVATK